MTLKDSIGRLKEFGNTHTEQLKKSPQLSIPQIQDLGKQSILSGKEAVQIGGKNAIDSVGEQYKVLVENTTKQIPVFTRGCMRIIRIFFENYPETLYALSHDKSNKLPVAAGGRAGQNLTANHDMVNTINNMQNKLKTSNVIFGDTIDANITLLTMYVTLIDKFSLMKTERLMGIDDDLHEKIESIKSLAVAKDWDGDLEEAKKEIKNRNPDSNKKHDYLFQILEVCYDMLIKCLELVNVYGEIIQINGTGDGIRESMILYQEIDAQIETTFKKEKAYFGDNHEQKGTLPEVTDPDYLEKMCKILEAHKGIMKSLQSGELHCNDELPDSYQ